MRKFGSISSANFLMRSIIILLLLPVVSKGQTVEQIHIDSMLKRLSVLRNDTSKVKLLNDISFTYFTVNPDEGIRFGQQGESLAEKLNWQKGVAASYQSIASNFLAKHNLLQAQKYYWASLKINEALSDKRGVVTSLHNLGVIYEIQYDYPKALEYYRKALTLSDELGDKFTKLGFLANIANVYQIQNDYIQALEYFMKSLKLCEEYGNERHIAYMSGRIGAIYTLQGEYAKALEYETKSLKTLEKFPDKNDIASVLQNIGDIYQRQHDYGKALEYFERAIKILGSVNTNWGRKYVGKYWGYIGNSYLSMATDDKRVSRDDQINNKFLIQKAVDNLKKAIKISNSVGDGESLRDCFQALSKAQSLQGNYAAALKSYKQYTLRKDSLNNVEKDKEMNRHELEYVYGRQKDSLDYLNKLQQSELRTLGQEKKLAKLTLKQQWLYSIIVFVIVCLVGSYILFQYRTQQLRLKNELIREKAEKQLKETEHQRRVNDITFSALRSQMNPHFIFNALNTIQSYVYSNDKKSASYYLGKFSELIRKILDNSSKQKIALEEEIQVLQLYIDIEKARFGDSFYASIEINPNMDIEDIFVPPMLIQPYAENAIKHGLLHMVGKKKLLIRISQSTDQQYIEIIIDDNGIGREKSIEINKKRIDHHSFANAANEKRIDLINQLDVKKTKLEIIDKKNVDGTAAGTTVIISIPVISVAPV